LAGLDGHEWSSGPDGGGNNGTLSGTAAVRLRCAWLNSGGTSDTLGESFLASGSGLTGLLLSGVLGLEESLDGLELGISVGGGGGEGGSVSIVFGVLAEGKLSGEGVLSSDLISSLGIKEVTGGGLLSNLGLS